MAQDHRLPILRDNISIVEPILKLYAIHTKLKSSLIELIIALHCVKNSLVIKSTLNFLHQVKFNIVSRDRSNKLGLVPIKELYTNGRCARILNLRRISNILSFLLLRVFFEVQTLLSNMPVPCCQLRTTRKKILILEKIKTK